MSTLPTEMPTGGVEFGGEFAGEVEAPVKVTKEIVEAPEEVAEEAAEEADVSEADESEGEEPAKKPKQSAQERIRELNKRARDLERENRQLRDAPLSDRLANIEKMLQGEPNARNNDASVPPNPQDLSKYPLGALDDRYVEDKIQFGIEQALGSVMQRQHENAQQAEAQRVATENLKRAEDVVKKGLALHDDYEEVVWEAGRRGDYRMDEPTFNALTEAEHGAEIAYALASDKAEAARVAALSPYGQVAYVAQKNAEFAARKVKLPKAGSPPVNTARGTGGSKSNVPIDTDNYSDINRMLGIR